MPDAKCLRCKRPARIYLKYLGKSLCDNCFCKLVERRISKNIRKNKLIQKGDKIAVAISGGGDSCLTLTYLAKYHKYKNIELMPIYIDRGDRFSEDSMRMAEKKAKDLGLPFYHFSFSKEFGLSITNVIKIAEKLGTNRCSVCGVLRRYLLNKKARELGATKLATGHNLTDEAQTHLMNFFKRELRLFAQLGPISPKQAGFVQRIKILRNIPKDEIFIYNKIKKIEFFSRQCPCRVSSLRYKIMPILEELKEARPAAEFSIVKIGDEIAELARQKFKNHKMGCCKNCGELSAKDVCKVCQYLELAKELR